MLPLTVVLLFQQASRLRAKVETKTLSSKTFTQSLTPLTINPSALINPVSYTHFVRGINASSKVVITKDASCVFSSKPLA